MKREEGIATQAPVNSLSCLGKPLSEGEFGGPGVLSQKIGTAAFEPVRGAFPTTRNGGAMLIAIAIIATGLLSGWGAAKAQCPPPSPSPLAEGEIGLFADLAATQTCIDSPPVTLRLYVVARVPQGGVGEFEAPTLLQSSGASLVFSRSAYANPGYQPLNIADDCPGGQRINLSSCPVAQGDLLTLAVIDVLAPSLGTYCFRSACESIGGVVGRAPTYRRCDDGTLHDFAGGDLMCIGIGSAPVAVQESMWGTVKVLYRDE